jgi:drug/metabolite transporter (DMT)-like permease
MMSPKPTVSGWTRPDGSAPAPRLWICRLAVALTQASFVIGSIYLKGSLRWVDASRGEIFSPIVYAFFREISAGPLLFAIAWLLHGNTRPTQSDFYRVIALGFSMFASQLFYIKGIQLSGVVVATCMQPTIPVFTVLLGVLLGMEGLSPRKLAGIGLAVLGAVSMVLGGASATEGSAAEASSMILGNMYLAINTFAMACYYLLSKKLVARYSPFQVAAWSYLVAATLMGCAALVFTSSVDWNFPRAMLLPLVYWVLIGSVGGYVIVTWAVKYLPASQVAAFQCLQPLLGTSLAFLILHEQLSWWDLGALGVLAGLITVSTERKKDAETPFVSFGGINRLQQLLGLRGRSRLRQGAAATRMAKEKTKQMPLLVYDEPRIVTTIKK